MGTQQHVTAQQLGLCLLPLRVKARCAAKGERRGHSSMRPAQALQRSLSIVEACHGGGLAAQHRQIICSSNSSLQPCLGCPVPTKHSTTWPGL